jgi:hypothetical protein
LLAQPPDAIGKPVFMPGDIKRAARALRQNARNAVCFLVAAFRTDRDLLAAWPASMPPKQKAAQPADQAAAHA